MQPCQGYLNVIIRVFRYLKKYHKGCISIDSSYPDHNKFDIKEYVNWRGFYSEAEDLILEKPNIPAKQQPALIRVYNDADHAHDVLTRRSVSGILLLISNTIVCWISKKKKTV